LFLTLSRDPEVAYPNSAGISVVDSHQHAGPKLNGYPTSTVTSITVAQNATPGFLREVIGVVPQLQRAWPGGFARRIAATHLFARLHF